MASTRAARRYLTATAVTIGLLGTACSSVSNPLVGLTTERAVGQSLGNLLDQPGLQAQFSLAVTGAQLRQLATQAGASRAVPQALLDGVSATSIVVDLHTTDGQNLSKSVGQRAGATTSSKVAFAITGRVGGDTPLELRFIGSSLYARLDLAKAYADYGQSPSGAASFEQSLGRANVVVPGIAALAQGKWVSADLSAFERMAGRQATPGSQQTSRNLALGLESALRNNTAFTNSGTHGGRTEYTISIAAKGFVTQFLGDVVKSLSANLPASALNAVDGLAAKIPAAQHITVQEYVKGDKAEEIDLDLAQFDAKFPFPVPLKVVLGAGGAVAAPSGAQPVDISRFSSMLAPLAGGMIPGLGQGTHMVPGVPPTPGSTIAPITQ